MLGDRQAEEIAFEDHPTCCDLRLLQLISQARALGVSVDEASLKRYSRQSASYAAGLAPMPSTEQLNQMLRSGEDWRARLARELPADPLRLLVWAEAGGSFPTIDWFATIRRVAATVAYRMDNGEMRSSAIDGGHLLRRFSLPFPNAAFDVMFAALVQRGEARYVREDGLAGGSRADPDRIAWRVDPRPYAAAVPPCPCCGRPRVLYGFCGGLTYGDWQDEAHHRFMQCPFDRYGCQERPGQFDCCHCAAISHLMFERKGAGQEMTVGEIEAEIARHLAAIEQAGGTPFPACSPQQ